MEPAAQRPPATSQEVCAVVVTYNRQELLREALEALLRQTQPVSRILVVNNVSTDGTLAMLARDFPASTYPQVEVLNLARNVGGAGGFHAGMKSAFADGCHAWIWLLDDDTIAEPDALEQLLTARARFPADAPGTPPPDLLASKVRWIDGDLHPMNISWGKLTDPAAALLAADRRTYSLRTATFVSCLIHRRHVERYGLPVADYFIWVDDTEYTGRILRENFGVLVPASVVLHKTVNKHTTLDANNPRFYYHVRNNLWMLTRSPAWTGKERLRLAIAFIFSLWKHLRLSHWSLASLRATGRGVLHGLIKHPTH